MKNLTLLVVFTALVYLGWTYFQPKPVPEPVPQVLTLEEQVVAIAQRGHTSSLKLAQLAQENPILVTKILRGKRIKVKGILVKANVRGAASDELSLELSGTKEKKITFVSNIQRLSFKGHMQNFSTYEKSGDNVFGRHQLLVANDAKNARVADRKLLYRVGRNEEIEGTFKYINATSVMFDWLPKGE